MPVRTATVAGNDNLLGTYLRDRRAKVDPAALGLSTQRRRTPGLRREEVAQRANVSATWYTWLEQGRGGAPSADVLDRIARALMLTDVEREHLFLLAQGRPPEVRYQAAGAAAAAGVPPRLQRILDALEFSPALIRTSTWDVAAWNRAATVVLNDYGALAPDQRNILRHLFGNPRARTRLPNWESDARFVVAAFRADLARAGATRAAQALVDELCEVSPEFAAMWRDHDVRVTYGEVAKHVTHPVAGPIALEYSAFAVDGQPDLALVIYNAATPADADRIRRLLTQAS
jgi:transcriptional regulator with XRE-family HTH domain